MNYMNELYRLIYREKSILTEEIWHWLGRYVQKGEIYLEKPLNQTKQTIVKKTDQTAMNMNLFGGGEN